MSFIKKNFVSWSWALCHAANNYSCLASFSCIPLVPIRKLFVRHLRGVEKIAAVLERALLFLNVRYCNKTNTPLVKA